MAKQQTVRDQIGIEQRLIEKGERDQSGRDPLELNDTNEWQELILEQEKGDMRQALANPAIRRFLYKLINLLGFEDHDSDPNPTIMAHHVGRRSGAVDMVKALKSIDPGVFWQMEREAKSNEASRGKGGNYAA
jgi:hypothetical protein